MIMLKLATFNPVNWEILTLSASQQAYVPIAAFSIRAVKKVAHSVNKKTNDNRNPIFFIGIRLRTMILHQNVFYTGSIPAAAIFIIYSLRERSKKDFIPFYSANHPTESLSRISGKF